LEAVTEAEAYIAAIADARRREEATSLDALFREATTFLPRLWSGRMIGYGAYDYTYASGHSGTSLATGFAVAPRQLTLYILPGYQPFGDIVARLGDYRTGKACVYISRLDRVDRDALKALIKAGLADLGTRWPVRPS
jgi:hypothetical protein